MDTNNETNSDQLLRRAALRSPVTSPMRGIETARQHRADSIGRSMRRRIMACLRLAHRVLGMKRDKLGLGLLGTALSAPGLSVSIGLAAIGAVAASNPAMAQFVTSNGATPTATGTNSSAAGAGASATASYALAIGAGASAANAGAFGPNGETNQGDIAIGSGAVAGPAAGGSTLALGTNAKATAPGGAGDSMAIGTSAVANAIDSTAIGGETTASGRQAIAIGNNGTTAAAQDSTVIGVSSTTAAAATQSIVLGNNSSSAVANQTILGEGASGTAAGIGGVALGQGAVANRAALAGGAELFSRTAVASTQGAVSVGAAGAERQIINVAGGTQATDAVNVRQLTAVGGNLATALGGGAGFSATTGAFTAPTYTVGGNNYNTVGAAITALGAASSGGTFASDNTAALGAPVATGANASAGGYGASATGDGSTVVGNGATDNGHAGAVAVGNNAAVLGAGSIAIGQGTTANTSANGQQVIDFRTAGQPNAQIVNTAAGTTAVTPSGIAIGQSSLVNPGGGVALGFNNNAGSTNGFFSTAIGANNLASGGYSTAIGENNQATNTGAIAIGVNNQATGLRSIAFGRQSYATGDLSVAEGFVASSYGANSVALGANSVAGVSGGAAANDVALGSGATSTLGNSVALGAGSVASRGAETGYTGYAVGAQTSAGEVAVGTTAAPRTITGVSAGRLGTDAVNVSQLSAVGTNLAGSLGGGAAFNPTTGAYAAPTYTVGGTNYNNVGAAITALGAVGGSNAFLTNGGTAPSATGTNASAGGSGATAAGLKSVAVGAQATASATNDIAIGTNAAARSSTTGGTIATSAIAIGANSVVSAPTGALNSGVAIGYGSNAITTNAAASSPVAIGYAANADGAGAQVAIGDRAVATGTDAIGIGGHANTAGVDASGDQSIAIGQTALSSGNSSVAIGNGVTAGGLGSLALGNNTTASVTNGVAIGTGANSSVAGGLALGAGSAATRTGLAGAPEAFSQATVASTQGAVSVGAVGAERQITNVAGGTQATDAVNVRQLGAVGGNLAGSLGGGAAFNPTTGAYTAPSYSVAGTTYNNVGSALTALGAGAGATFVSDNTGAAAAPVATGANASAGGYGASATGPGSTVVGNSATDNGQGGAVAVGNDASAGTSKSIAIGQGATTVAGGGVAAVAIGNAAVAQGDGAVALGLISNANGTGATAGGNHSTATGDSAVAFGDLANATGTSATSFGVKSKAAGESAFAAGTGASATGASAFAMGTGSSASQDGAIAFGGGAASSAGNAVSLGAGSSATVANGLALGAGSAATRAGLAGATEAFSQTTVASTQGAVSVGAVGAERQITNVAGGTQATDAVNVRQLSAVGSNLAGSLGGGAAFDPTTGAYTAPAFTTAAGTTATTVQAALGNETAAITSLGTGTATKLGGGVTYNPTTGLLGNGFTVGGTTYGDVASAISGAAANDGLVQRTGTAGQVAVTAPGGTGANPGAAQVVTNVAAGQVAAASTQAVNGGQLYGTAASVASGLGGNAMVNPDGTVSAPTYTVGGQTYNNVGAALTAGNNLAVQYTPDATGAPTNAVDLTKGGTLAPVAVTGLANATTATGAVTLAQMPLQYSTAAAPTTANPAIPSGDVTLVGATAGTPVGLHNVAAGTLSATSTDAVNGSQLFGVSSSVNALGTTTAAAIGGNAAYTPGVGISGLSYTLNGAAAPFTNVVAGEQALASGAAGPVQYAVPGTPGNAVNLVGTGGPVTIGNVAPGVLSATSTDAVNGSQLFTTNQQVAGLTNGTAGLVQQDPATRAISVGAGTDGTTVGFANNTGAARTLTGVAAGQVAAGSTQAINGGQLAGTAGSVATALGGGATVNPDGTLAAPTYTVGGTSYNNVGGAIGALTGGSTAAGVKYFHANSTGADSSATGTDAVAVGSGSTSTQAGGVALGSGAAATRAGLGGGAEAFSGTAIASTQGAVSVGATGAERQITNVAGGTQATDAVNLRQLSSIGSNLAGSLGGGAAFDPATGAYTAPLFTTAAGTTATTVQAALGNETAAITALGNGTASKFGGGVTYNPTTGQLGNGFTVDGTTYADVASAVSGVAANNGLVQRTATPGQVAITAPGGTGTNPGAAQVVTNVAAGQIAVGSTQAVNGGQLFGSAASVASGLGGGSTVNPDGTVSAPTYTVGGQNYDNVGSALAASNALGVQYTPDAAGNPTNAIDLTKGGALAPVALTGLANATAPTGAVALGQMPTQYSSAGAPTTANPAVPSNDVTLVGADAAAPVGLHNVAAGALTATSTDAVNGAQLYATNQTVTSLANGTAGLVQQDPTGRGITVGAGTDGATVGFANNAGAARTLTGVAAGTVAVGSTQAVNGSQLAGTAGSVANALGGGSTVNADGTLSTPTYNVANGTYNNVGSALTALDNGIATGKLGAFVADNSAGRAGPSATGANASAGGFGAVATGAGSTVLGNAATDDGAANATVLGSNGSATQAGGVALGAGSTATRAGLAGATEAFSGTAVASTQGAVSVGAADAERQITNVAGGTQATDAVNVRQLTAVGSSLAGSLGGGAAFDPATGAYTAPTYTVGGKTYDNVGAAMAAGSALAVQYTPDAAGGATNAIDLTKGGTLNPVTMTGLAAGALTATSTAAVNGSQLYATNQTVAGLANGTVGLVQQDPTTRAITVGAGTDGTSVGFANNGGAARTLTGVAAGQVASGSTQAVNGGQLYGTAGSVASALGGGSAVKADGTVSAPTYGVDGKTYNNVGGAITALDTTGVKYDVVPTTGARGQSITLAGGDPNQPVVIHNVGAGTVRTDAANYGQVQDAQAAANQYTNQKVSGIENELSGVNNRLSNLESSVTETRQEARTAAAIGLAAGSLRYDDRPGKFSVATGGGYWRGEAAAAFGLGYTLPDGRFRLNATAATAGYNVGVGAGATYTFN